ncbi:formate dehydrogenase accessory sulfurtransferase FdhD [Niabella sp. CC-SYL272]|uniref:formate dehydrogenase accessory sulfurtransferase FdhD n=1 Tax=Niabella agricola TaxID=2891571 RepID=UPI001F1FC508|nr:formate dehydrogenase accessory sulfurtransferase FdhD [Niabella agricola]MCF3110649.1 formate dehydrogenase accessory sulfurtransferase FdhD [Niabella agricola]
MKMNGLEPASVKKMPVKKVDGSITRSYIDTLSVEEPLEIKISYSIQKKQERATISVTMRTPGKDVDLALGFLFTEGIIGSIEQVQHVGYLDENVLLVTLKEEVVPQLSRSDRNFYTTSSCGVCGKTSIESISTVSRPFRNLNRGLVTVAPDIFYSLPEKLRATQDEFSATGGIHASGLFSINGELLFLREDVGRHNALDKLVGYAFTNHQLPLQNGILLLSGRASFELIQKAAMAGISIVAAIGAPSTLAVTLARESDITLLGFLKKDRFNIYHQSSFLQIAHLNEDQD